MLVTNQF